MIAGPPPAGQREAFTPAVVPPYLRRIKSLEELIPRLDLKGISTGAVSQALQAILGSDAPHLSATTLTRLKAVGEQDHDAWSKRSLWGTPSVAVWADGGHFNLRIRLEEGRQCILVLRGAAADGKKELSAIADGDRESEQSWKELLLDVKDRGLEIEPSLALGAGAWGFWAARPKVGDTTATVRDTLPTGSPPQAKRMRHEISQAESGTKAEKAFDLLVKTYQAKDPKATEWLVKDRSVLLTVDDFPAEHGAPIQTTNPIESVVATVRLRHNQTKGSGSR